MKIIKPSFEVLSRDEQRGNIGVIELAARTCYKTEDAVKDGSDEQIVSMLIARQHTAMLEHGDYIFLVDDYKILDNVAYCLYRHEKDTGHRIRLFFTDKASRPIISGNIRAWRELMASYSMAAWYFSGAIDPIFIGDIVPEEERVVDGRIHQLHYADLKGGLEQRVHLRQTVRFTVDRGVTHEFVRHREMSFAQESTRYCNYNQNKFGNEITVIEPCFLTEGTEEYSLWKRQCMSAEAAYSTMLHLGMKPQEARTVLPHSTKADLIVTGTLGQWRSFFDLRALEVTGPAHPQAAEVAKALLPVMASRFPAAFAADNN
ncbi:MAG: FAD-dependent thymidylate synthase [Oscillospiraceae bacterium]|nr:FAD-dependent thymidylate synthase [Oscillospiraceae bacterium]